MRGRRRGEDSIHQEILSRGIGQGRGRGEERDWKKSILRLDAVEGVCKMSGTRKRSFDSDEREQIGRERAKRMRKEGERAQRESERLVKSRCLVHHL